MTCFKLKDGSTVHSKTTMNQYRKYVRLIEKGYTSDRAFDEATKETVKDNIRLNYADLPPSLLKYIKGRMYRTKCSFDEAYHWAKSKGRCYLNFSDKFERTLNDMKTNSLISHLSNVVESLLEFAPEDVCISARKRVEKGAEEYIERLDSEYEAITKNSEPYSDKTYAVSLNLTKSNLKTMLKELQKHDVPKTTYVTMSGTYTI